MEAICIPVGEPLTFRRLRDLNPDAAVDELASAFQGLPPTLRDQAWTDLRLRLELEEWNDRAVGDRDAG